MNTKQQEYLNKLLSDEEKSKKFFEKVIEEDNAAAHLLRWIIDNDIMPYNVFPNYMAGQFYSIRGIAYLYSILTHALFDDGDIEFLKITKIYESGYKRKEYPRIVFNWRGEDNFHIHVIDVLQLPHEDFMGEEKISYEFGVLSDVYEYIEEYEIVEKEEKELEEKWLS
jgi:hypothetical protein